MVRFAEAAVKLLMQLVRGLRLRQIGEGLRAAQPERKSIPDARGG